MSALEIPHLGTVPRTWSVHCAEPTLARAALALLDLGFLDGRARSLMPAELVRQGMQCWADGVARGLQFFELHLSCGNAVDGGGDPSFALTLTVLDINHVSIGRRLAELERRHPGLGQTVLYWIGEAARHAVPIFTPAYALDAACWSYWAGCPNEAEIAADMKLQGDTYDGLTRAEFDRAIPRWASHPRPRLSGKAIKALCRLPATSNTGRVARALLTLIGAIAENAPRIETGPANGEGLPVFPPAVVLHWHKTQIIGRVFDDAADYFMESGEYAEKLAQSLMLAGDDLAKNLRTFLDGVTPMLQIVRTIDQLLDLIKDSRDA